MAGASATLSRPVFFVPGWAGETGDCWTEPYANSPKRHAPAKTWIERIVPAADRKTMVRYLSFTLAESRTCQSFLDFGPILKAKIRAAVAAGNPIDLVCHSMGSLDAIAAVTQPPAPLLDVVNLIAAGSPLQGIFYGKLVQPIDELLPFVAWQPQHYTQVRNMDHLLPPIQLINTLETRRRLLERIGAFHGLEGTQDAVVMRSARLKTDGMDQEARSRVHHRQIAGATHTGPAGVTQDPRTIREIFRILLGK